MATAYIPKKGDAQKNRDRYNAATSGSQSISDYISSGGNTTTTTNSSSGKTGSTITTMRGTGNSSSKTYEDTLKENITNTVNNPTAGAYSSLGNNSLMKDMVIAYNYSTGGTKTPTVVTETVEEVYNPYDELDSILQAYKEQQEALIREQNRLAVEQGTNRLNAQKESINQSADENARQAYIQYMQSQKALPQQLASQGVSGGATETANLGIQTNYQNNVNAINQNKANRLQEIDNAIVDLQNTGDLTMVEQVLANNQAALDAYMNTFDKSVGYNQWAQQFNANREDTLADQAYRDKVYADQMIQQDKENQWYEDSYKDAKKKDETDRVITLLENGIYNPATASALLGVSTDQLQEFVDYIKKVRQLEISNTQSLINNRNDSGNPKAPSKTEVFNDALAMSKTEGWTAEDVIRFVMGQGLSEVDEMTVLQKLGLLTDVAENNIVESNTNISHGGGGRSF